MGGISHSGAQVGSGPCLEVNRTRQGEVESGYKTFPCADSQPCFCMTAIVSVKRGRPDDLKAGERKPRLFRGSPLCGLHHKESEMILWEIPFRYIVIHATETSSVIRGS